ncbi:methionine adenosyltransferase [Streptomyces sp. NPDC026206]|uniref:methionine adenosyltransferase n=1 Tax=Streptomyces sp. NPDC026206 TaxID=3157089 RepID=UPI0033FDDAC5
MSGRLPAAICVPRRRLPSASPDGCDRSAAGQPLPLRDILAQAAHEQLQAALPGYDRALINIRHETTDSSKFAHWFTPRGLADLPERGSACSNDTALLVGTAPHTRTETAALVAESYLCSQPWAGSDIKALAARIGHEWDLTVCVLALAGTVHSAPEFHELLAAATTELQVLLAERLPGPVRIHANTRGSATAPLSGQYFTVTGSAVDYGEDGLVGRGNARSGLITSAHAAGNEALFGKNPAYHVGKVGGWLVDQAAVELSEHFGPSRVAAVWRIGSPYPEPAFLDITTDADPDQAEELVREVLSCTDWLTDLTSGERYRPTVQPLAELLDQLEHSP